MPRGFKPIQEEDTTYSCKNKNWPPVHVKVYGTDLEEIRQEVTNQEYHKLKTWERVCGLLEMELEKCKSCPYVLVNGVSSVEPGIGKRVPLGRHTPRNKKKDM